jgi:hypothetical protein
MANSGSKVQSASDPERPSEGVTAGVFSNNTGDFPYGVGVRPPPPNLPISLYLYVARAPSGVKSWQFRYRLDGKQQTQTLGKLPRCRWLKRALLQTAREHRSRRDTI